MSAAECLFCRIASRTLPANIVAESEELLAFQDINPQAPTHLLVMPREHVSSLTAATPIHNPLLGRALRFAAQLAHERGLSERGFRVVINTGPEAGQSVDHLHLHLLGGRTLRWPPG